MTDKTVANTILNQLGGNKFIMMTGAKQFFCDDNSLGFKIGKNAAGVNYVKITLNAMDTYDMVLERVSFIKKTGETKRKVIGSHEGIYDDMLQACFTNTTGMYTSLGTMGR